MNVRVVALAVVSLAAVAPLAACSGSSSSSAPRPTPSTGLTATRWWSNSADKAGSTIDAGHPNSAAGKLHVSSSDYCSMLKQTVAAGKSILPGVTAKDPALLASTKAFVAEIQAVAPSSVAAPWQVLGGAVVSLVESGGDMTKVKGIDAAAVQKAAGTIAADAKASCDVDLSSVTS